MMAVHVCMHACMLYVCLCVVTVVYMHLCKHSVRAGSCNYVDVPQFCPLSLLLGEGSLETLEESPATVPTVDNTGHLHTEQPQASTETQHRPYKQPHNTPTQKDSDRQLLVSYVIQHPSALWLLHSSSSLQLQQCISVHLD